MKVRKLIDEADKAQEAKAKIKVDAAVVEAIDLLRTRLADELQLLWEEIQQVRKDFAETLADDVMQLRRDVDILKRNREN